MRISNLIITYTLKQVQEDIIRNENNEKKEENAKIDELFEKKIKDVEFSLNSFKNTLFTIDGIIALFTVFLYVYHSLREDGFYLLPIVAGVLIQLALVCEMLSEVELVRGLDNNKWIDKLNRSITEIRTNKLLLILSMPVKIVIVAAIVNVEPQKFSELILGVICAIIFYLWEISMLNSDAMVRLRNEFREENIWR